MCKICAQISFFLNGHAGTIILRCEKLVPFFPTNVKNRYKIITHVKNRYQILTSVKIGIKSSHVKSLYQNHTCEELVPNPPTCENLVPNYHRCGELVIIVTDVSDKIVKNSNRTQNAAEEYACMPYEIRLRVYFLPSVIYWYEICDVLVPILHSMRFAKCEICCSYSC